MDMHGTWALVGCPEGYELNFQQCNVCPGGYYCIGGSVPATPCGPGFYALPGAKLFETCSPAVFVVVTIQVPISRYSFSDDISRLFQEALASVCGLDSGYVVISGIVGDIQTSVSSNIATSDAKSAAELAQVLNGEFVHNGLNSHGFSNCTLEAVQVTGCLPGYELSESQACQLCPAGSFCVGGASSSTQCSAGFYAPAGSNSSNSCKPAVFVIVVVILPISNNNFTVLVTSRFQMALAAAAAVSLQNVFVVTSAQGRRVGPSGSASSVQVTAEIAVSDTNAAQSIVNNMSPSVLNKCLILEGLPPGSLQSITTTALNSVYQGSSLPVIVGALIGSFLLLFGIVTVYFIGKAEPEDERELRRTIENLRVQLCITAQYGYFLGCQFLLFFAHWHPG